MLIPQFRRQNLQRVEIFGSIFIAQTSRKDTLPYLYINMLSSHCRCQIQKLRRMGERCLFKEPGTTPSAAISLDLIKRLATLENTRIRNTKRPSYAALGNYSYVYGQ